MMRTSRIEPQRHRGTEKRRQKVKKASSRFLSLVLSSLCLCVSVVHSFLRGQPDVEAERLLAVVGLDLQGAEFAQQSGQLLELAAGLFQGDGPVEDRLHQRLI